MASSNNGNTQWYQPTAGLNNVGSYQVSSIPWVSSSVAVPASTDSVKEISFPRVTKNLVIKNETSNIIKISFSEKGLTTSNNYFSLGENESFASDFRVTKLFLRGSSAASTVTIIAGLTGIDASELPNSWSGSSGVG